MAIRPNKTKYRYRFRNKIKFNENKINHIKKQNLTKYGDTYLLNSQICHYDLSNMRANLPYIFHKPLTKISFTKPALNPTNPNYHSNHFALFGNYGIAFENHGKLSAKFIQTVRLDIAKTLKKQSRVWLRLCCDTPVTARSVESRMGKGKGSISHWESRVVPGQMLFEFSGLSRVKAQQILTDLRKKSPYALKLVF